MLVADGVAAGGDPAWRDFCLRQADAVVLVARGRPPRARDTGPVLVQQPDLVLVGAVPLPADRVAWVAAHGRLAADAWSTATRGAGVPSIADRLAGRSLGLVLAGGGARAFAHVGVLRELEEAGCPVDRIAGASVGAAIAGIYAIGRDGAELEERPFAEFVARNPFSDWTIPTHALTRGVRVRASVDRRDSARRGRSRGCPRQLHAREHRPGEPDPPGAPARPLVDGVLASSRLPVLFPPIPTDERPAADRRRRRSTTCPSTCSSSATRDRSSPSTSRWAAAAASGRARGGRPRVPALGETLLRTMMIGAGGAVDAAQRRGAVVITPATLGVGLLEFHQIDRMVLAGREAARALLAEGGPDLAAGAGPRPDAPVAVTLPPPREQPAASR